MEKLTEIELANKIINELKGAGFTIDEMFNVVKLARKKYERMKKIKK